MHSQTPVDDVRTALIVSSLFHGINDGTFAILPAVLPFAVKDFLLSYFDIGLLYAAMMLIIVIFQPITGALADRFDELDLLAIGGSLIFVACVMLFYTSSYIQLFLLNLLYAVGYSVYHPVSYTVLSRISHGVTYRTKAMGLSGSVGDLGNFSTFISTGFIAVYLGWRFPFLLWGILAFLGTIVYIVFLRRRRVSAVAMEHRTDPSQKSRQRGRTGRRHLALIVTLFIFLGALYRTFIGFTTLYLTDVIHLTPANSDYLFSAFVLFGVIGAFLSGYIAEHLGLERALILEFAAVSACMLLLYLDFIQTFPLVALPLVVGGLALYATYPALYSFTADFRTFGKRGFSYGILASTTFAGGFAVSLLNGQIADLTASLSTVYLLGGVMALIAALTADSLRRNANPTRECD
ncbi:MAG: MFS transporter [Candidatus Bathyarchaeia archaeon]